MKEIKNILRIIIYSASLYIWYIIGIYHFLFVCFTVNIGNFSEKDLEDFITSFVLMVIFCFINPFILYSLAKITGVLKLFKKKKIKLIRYIRKSNKASKIGNIIYITIFSLLFTVSILFLFLISGIALMFWNPFQYTYIPDLIELILIIIFAILLLYPVFAVFLLIYMFIKNRCKNKQVKLNL